MKILSYAIVVAIIAVFALYYFYTGRLDVWSTWSEYEWGLLSGAVCVVLLQFLMELIFYDAKGRDNQKTKG